MQSLLLEQAVSLMKQECEQSPDKDRHPFFFIVGAGISSPPLPLASEIVEHCRSEATRFGRAPSGSVDQPIDAYSTWFQLAYPAPVARQTYLRQLIQGKPISEANLRLAHILLSRRLATTAVTPNFDDFLSRALTLFGSTHVLCDHPQTTERIDPDAAGDIQIVHVHGNFSFYDCCNLAAEVEARAQRHADTNFTMSFLLDSILRAHAPIVVGYSGWESDVIMSALRRRLQSALPHNLYWFCYSQRELDTLPDWLKQHRNVFVIVPGDTSDEAAPMDGGISKSAEEARLPAKTVFDAIIRVFALETPALTRDPLEFMAQHLRASLYGGGVESTDIYGIRSVIQRIERARQLESTTAPGDDSARLELIREAIRGSEYDEAISIAASMKIEQMDADVLRQLVDLLSTAMAEQDLDAPTLACDTLMRVNTALLDRNAIDYDEWSRRVAHLLLEKGKRLEDSDEDGSIAAYNEIYTRFGDNDDADLALERTVAEALVRKADVLLNDAGGNDAAGAVADLILVRYHNPAPEFLIFRARALGLKVETALAGGRFAEAVEYADQLLENTSANQNADLAGLRANTSFCRADALRHLGRRDEALAELERLLAQLASSPGRVLRWRAFRLKARMLHEGGDIDAALATFDAAIDAFRSYEPPISGYSARLLLEKAELARDSDRKAEATTAIEMLIRDFGKSSSGAIRQLVRRAERLLAPPTQ